MKKFLTVSLTAFALTSLPALAQNAEHGGRAAPKGPAAQAADQAREAVKKKTQEHGGQPAQSQGNAIGQGAQEHGGQAVKKKAQEHGGQPVE